MSRPRAAVLLLLLLTPLVAASNTTQRHRKSWTREELALADAVEGEEYRESEESTTPSAGLTGGCPACRLREEMKLYSLEQIKEQILTKLGIDQPPNTTGRALPKVPEVLLDRYRKSGLAVPGMLGDQPIGRTPAEEEDDDFHVKTEKVIAFAHRSNHSRK